MALFERRVEAILLAQSFQVMWAYYIQSDGTILADKTKQAAQQFLLSYDKLNDDEQIPEDSKAIKFLLGSQAKSSDIINSFREWANSNSIFPWENALESRLIVYALIVSVIQRLWGMCDELTEFPSIPLTVDQISHSEYALRWRPHLPPNFVPDDPVNMLKSASSSPTIAVVGDIRRSQEIMTYASTAADFTKRIIRFINRTRELIGEHYGIFDKFTGDGFIAYFNKKICEQLDKNYIDCFIDFIREELEFARVHFSEWQKNIRKLPDCAIGLSLGADIGKVNFNDVDDHFVAVGDTIVWASRMATAAEANEIVINNILSVKLSGIDGLTMQQKNYETKTGEGFAGFMLEIESP